MLRLMVAMAAVSSAAAATASTASYHGRRGGHDAAAPRYGDHGVHREANDYRYSGYKGMQTQQTWRGFPFDDDDDDDDDDNGDYGGWSGSHKKTKKKKSKHKRHGDGEDSGHGHGNGYDDEGDGQGDGYGYGGNGDDEGDGRGWYGPGGDQPPTWDPHGHVQGKGDDKGDDHGSDDRDGKDNGNLPSGEIPGRRDPINPVRSALQIRQDTESFASSVLAWVNDLITPEAASTLVVDTSFSLTKNEGATFQPGAQSSSGLAQLFPVVERFVSRPQDVDLVEEDFQSLGWNAALASSGLPSTAELEGGIYATFQVTCDERIVLNVSISSSGSTPTIQGEPVENSGLYVDVNILDGTIQATDAQGSLIGLIKRRHYPENAADVLKNWTTTVQGCAAAKSFSVTGSVGGGWTEYKPDNSTPGGYEDFAVGYAETFTFTFPEEAIVAVQDAAPVGTLRANAVDPFLPAAAPASDVTGALAAAYVQLGVSCGQRPAAYKLSCGEAAVMSQLQSFHKHAAIANNRVVHATHLEATPTGNEASRDAVYVGIVGVMALAVVAGVLLTQRRRDGYQTLAVHV